MLVSASYQNCKIKHLPLRQKDETSCYHKQTNRETRRDYYFICIGLCMIGFVSLLCNFSCFFCMRIFFCTILRHTNNSYISYFNWRILKIGENLKCLILTIQPMLQYVGKKNTKLHMFNHQLLFVWFLFGELVSLVYRL